MTIEGIVKSSLSTCESNGISSRSNKKLQRQQCVDHVALNEDPSKLEVLLDRLNDSAVMFGVCFASSKSIMLLHMLIVRTGEELG